MCNVYKHVYYISKSNTPDPFPMFIVYTNRTSMLRTRNNGQSGQHRGVHQNFRGYPQRNPLKTTKENNEFKISEAQYSGKHPSQTFREMSRHPVIISDYYETSQALRGEPINYPTPPDLPVAQGTAFQRANSSMEYQAKYNLYAENTESTRKQSLKLKMLIHNDVMDRRFRQSYETSVPEHAALDLSEYITSVKNHYNLTISSQDSERREYAKRQWQDIQQGETETLEEFNQNVRDTVDRYNSVMTEPNHLTTEEVAEKYIRSLNSKFVGLKSITNQDQLTKSREIARRHPDPVPYLDHLGYPANLNEAYTRAKDYEESTVRYKQLGTRLSNFATVAESEPVQPVQNGKVFTNQNTGETKTRAELTAHDNPFHFGLKRCNKCAEKYPGDHFSSFHDEAIELKRKARASRSSEKKPAKKKYDPKQKGRNKAQFEDRVKSAFATLKKAQKEAEKAATASSKKASEYGEVLSSFG